MAPNLKIFVKFFVSHSSQTRIPIQLKIGGGPKANICANFGANPSKFHGVIRCFTHISKWKSCQACRVNCILKQDKNWHSS